MNPKTLKHFFHEISSNLTNHHNDHEVIDASFKLHNILKGDNVTDDNELDALCNVYFEHNEELKQVKNEIKDLRDRILHESTESKYFTDRYYIEIKDIKTNGYHRKSYSYDRIFLFKKNNN